jgi:phosphoribosyl 1,2-cyclic phosphodiesterase
MAAGIATLYSGSSGNSTLVCGERARVLVDMGCSCKKTLGELYSLGVSAKDIDAVFITHEHSDHVGGLLTFLSHYGVPVYGSERTLRYLRERGIVPKSAKLEPLEKGAAIKIGDITARCFSTSHDSADCVGYRFGLESGASIAVATDLGFVSDEVFAELLGCSLVALESNYDDTMLLSGKYPYYLKARIRSHVGHLSNRECAEAAVKLAEGGTKRLVLMHLSRENNIPELALTGCLSILENYGITEEVTKVSVAPRHECSGLIEV